MNEAVGASGRAAGNVSQGPLRVGIAGLGTVGGGVVRLIDANSELLARRAGRPIVVTAVSSRERSRDRGFDISRFAWEDNAQALVTRPDVDVVVELIGGADGPALALAQTALTAGKPYVTANKAMLAHHGMELTALAEKQQIPLKFEAAVAGGIPVIKGLCEGASANAISRVHGILNGTCNYILTRMEKEGLEFGDVLADAQRLGFAESDPTFDIDGVDAAHKLAILSAIAFGARLDFAGVETTGIRDIGLADIRQAEALGYRVRLVGSAELVTDGPNTELLQRVHPSLVAIGHPLAAVEGPLNAVVAEGNFVGQLLFQGRGAGDGPTASAVVADLMDIARGNQSPAFAMPVQSLVSLPRAGSGHRSGRYYLRLTVRDQPGVLADVAAALRDAGVSIESLIQPASHVDGTALLVMVTHESAEQSVLDAIAAMEAMDVVTGHPLFMPILGNEG